MTSPIDLEQDIDDTFNKEIARELIIEHNPNATDAMVDTVWAACKGNPWNAGILYVMLEHTLIG